MKTRTVTALVVVSLCGAVPALPQQPGQFGPPSVVHRSVATWSRGDEITAEGTNYQARFRDEGFTFRTAVDDRTRLDLDLGFRLLGARRRGSQDRGLVAEPVMPTHDGAGHPVRYARGDLVETYDLRPDGVKQSFVFSVLPPGDGDLVVRGTVETVLPVAHASADELRFEIEGVGGVRVGAVLGIDANGARVTGALRYADGVLEMSLPAAFVDAAALPLVLDPLVGSTISVSSVLLEGDPDVAFDSTNDVYLVVWESVAGIRGRRVDEDGNLVGSNIAISGSGGFNPSVASVGISDMFLVVWEQDSAIWAATVDAATGAVPKTSQLQGAPDSFMNPDVGTTRSGNAAIVVWTNTTQSRIQAQRLLVQPTGGYGVFSPVDITPGAYADFHPAISKSGGADGRFLICWERTLTGVHGQIRGAIVDSDVNLLDSWIDIASSGRDEDFPDVDGDGTYWVVAYQTEAIPLSGDNDIACVGVAWDPSAGVGYVSNGEVIVEGDLNDDELNPAVAWMGDSALIGFADQTSFGDYDAYLVSVDPFHCLPCEGEFTLAATSIDDGAVAITSQRSSGGSSSAAMIAWHFRDTASGTFGIEAVRFAAEDGVQSTSVGQCGAASDVVATCAVAGNSAFTMRIMHTTPAVPVWLIVSAGTVSLGCGSCTLVADPFSGVVFSPGTTDARGNADATFAIPHSSSLVGARFYMQWLISGSSCIGLDFSSAYRIRIE